jgi:acetyltransferase-like isoleucine patch superfamily enzyme
MMNESNPNVFRIINEDGSIEYSPEIKGVQVVFQGEGGLVELQRPFLQIHRATLQCGANCRIFIGRRARLLSLQAMITAENSTLRIGNSFFCAGLLIKSVNEPNLDITIGNNCLFSSDIIIRTSDGHSIFDCNSKELLNHASKGVSIGDRVWVGRGAHFMKESSIPNDCVVGAGSLVTNRPFEEHSIIAGIPAKTVRTGISWAETSPQNYRQKK